MSLAYKISAWNRKRKLKLFLKEFQPTTETTILDTGFQDEEYTGTENFLEKNFSYLNQITALSLDAPKASLATYPNLRVVTYDGKVFPFPDQSFDICWSNAVLEHVGTEEQQVLFLKEIKRVAKTAFITTPNKYFPIEVHTLTPLLHFLPKEIFDRYLSLIGKEWAAGDYMKLLSVWDVHRLLHQAGVKNYKIFKNRFFLFPMDFAIVFKAN
ncbi:MAG: SAM-dependent methyltransferase [Cyanobacteria bacterium QS_3_48_167]|nr:MAG: SAM-dependent methyltransferase [Cyanobacteria bacterium QS_3_48_167]